MGVYFEERYRREGGSRKAVEFIKKLPGWVKGKLGGRLVIRNWGYKGTEEEVKRRKEG